MRDRARSFVEIARLRRRGLAISWDVRLGGSTDFLSYGERCGIGRGSMVWMGPNGPLKLGDKVVLGEYSNVRASSGAITIGSRVLFAQFVSLISANHLIGDDGVPSWEHVDMARRGIEIGDDCWLGAQAVILPGVSLGDRCIVGAGAVVTRSFPSGSRLAGVPARSI